MLSKHKSIKRSLLSLTCQAGSIPSTGPGNSDTALCCTSRAPSPQRQQIHQTVCACVCVYLCVCVCVCVTPPFCAFASVCNHRHPSQKWSCNFVRRIDGWSWGKLFKRGQIRPSLFPQDPGGSDRFGSAVALHTDEKLACAETLSVCVCVCVCVRVHRCVS